MYMIISAEPAKKFFLARSQKEYIKHSRYFIMKSNGMIDRTNVTNEVIGPIIQYSYFDNSPLYVSLMSDNYWHRNKGDVKNAYYVYYTPGVPDCFPLSDVDREGALPYEDRWDVSIDYLTDVCNSLLSNNFNKTEFVEAKIDPPLLGTT